MARNITLSVDDAVLDEVRVYAARRQTTVNGLVREFLVGLAQQEDRTGRARRRLQELMDNSTADVGPLDWSRQDLHDR